MTVKRKEGRKQGVGTLTSFQTSVDGILSINRRQKEVEEKDETVVQSKKKGHRRPP